MRPLRGVAHVLNIEEEEARLGGVRFDRKSAELGAVEFVELLLGLLVLVAAGEWEWLPACPGLVLLALTCPTRRITSSALRAPRAWSDSP